MTLHLGQAIARGNLNHYAKFFDLLEISAEAGRLPRAPVLKRWREGVPRSFMFSVAVGSDHVGAASIERLVAPALEAAETLSARWLVLRSGRELTPTARNRDYLAQVVSALRDSTRNIAWRPEGLWTPEEARDLAARLDVCWVADVGRDDLPEREHIYCVLRSLGSGGVVASGPVERAAERLQGRGDACVILEGRGAGRAASQLRGLVAELQAEFYTDSDEHEERQKASHES